MCTLKLHKGDYRIRLFLKLTELGSLTFDLVKVDACFEIYKDGQIILGCDLFSKKL